MEPIEKKPKKIKISSKALTTGASKSAEASRSLNVLAQNAGQTSEAAAPVAKKFNPWAHKNKLPSALGSKEIPAGKEDCLAGLTFVLTGLLSSLTRDDTLDLIKRCGGRVTSAVSSKTSYLIVGEDPGETKLTKANSLSIPTLDEDAFYALVRSKEGSQPNAEIKVNAKEEPKAEPKMEPKEEPKVEPMAEAPAAKKFNFWAVKNAAPSALGSKEIPVGVENSLAGKTFVLTGQLSSITREDTADLIKKCGGRVTSAVSSKTTYLVLGEDSGPSKIEKARSLGVQTLDEDQLFALIRSFEGQEIHPPASPTKKPAAKKIKISVKPEAASTEPSIVPIAAACDRPIVTKPISDLWVDKYKPSKLSELVGNNTNIKDLREFLGNWDPKKLDAKSMRAVLISGPPGIGKTTSAHLACKEAGFSPIEFNASDTRSKSSIEDILGQYIDNRSISEFFRPSSKPQADLQNCRPALILDEIDGMSGGDRGGVAEIIKYIKKTKVPIICICNDRMSPKVRSLATHCVDLKFRRPTVVSVKPLFDKITRNEGLSLSSNVIDKLFEMSHSDIRQVITLLSTWRLSNTAMSYDQGKAYATQLQKNTILDPFKIVEKYLNAAQFGNHTLNERIDFYYHDFQIAPLMVHENYLRCRPRKVPTSNPNVDVLKHLELLSEAADCISQADIVDRSIHLSQNWGLMPIHAAYSCAMPSDIMHGYMSGPYFFSSWLGQNSKSNKHARLLKETHLHLKSRISGNKNELRQSYLPTLVTRLTKPLAQEGQADIPAVIHVMDHYFLEKDDWDALVDLRIFKGKNSILESIPSAVKSAFTRSYNKADHPTIVHAKLQTGRSKGKAMSNAATAAEMDDVLAAEDDTVEPEEDESNKDSDNPEDDKLVSKKTVAAKRKASTASTRGAKKPRGRGK
ncbi:DNA replication factor C complex subunit Rfc1 [Entomophthora muscae]|uniref:DNA replication factor C complex subunit Rfc1 n=1 Tax=Entomophthora muscae TaxID=34485 RepID=A0ACC2SP70_9FUNG|nr:DNA replication factor C complex subunit Rfc1 [Entomophthora muscae]